jgi:DNA-directed RNA polymerase specialized sigma subunit
MTLLRGEADASPFLLRAGVERAELLSECLAELPLRWQAVLAIRYGAGLTLRGAGAVLGVSAVAVLRSERRALAAMRAGLARRGIQRFDEV